MNESLTEDVLDRLDDLSRKATPGPWFWNSYSTVFSEPLGQIADDWPLDGDDIADPDRYYFEAEARVAGVPAFRGDTAHGRHAADAKFIAACDPGTIGTMIREIRALRQREVDSEHEPLSP